MRLSIRIIIFVLFALIPSITFAQLSDDTVQLVRDFRAAVKTHKKEKIKEMYLRVKESPAAVEYLKSTGKEYYGVFERYALLERLEGQRAQLSDGRSTTKEEILPAETVAKEAVATKTTNRDIVESSPNQDRPSNDKIGKAYPNQERMNDARNNPNSKQTRNNANQDRISNSRRAKQLR